MTSIARRVLAFSVVALGLAPRLASAQMVVPPEVPQYFPDRYENGVKLTTLRPNALNPNGINYADCVADLTLEFNLTLSGFTGKNASLEIWATANGDCTALSTRQGTPQCWKLPGGLVQPADGAQTFQVRAQDLVGPQGNPPNPPAVVSEGASACTAQSGFSAVPITLWFLPVDASGNLLGMPFFQTIATDLVGPPPPVNVMENVGNTIFNATWTANTDGDTIGYDVFADSPQASGVSEASTTASGVPYATAAVPYCLDSGAAANGSDASSDDGSDASSDDGGDASIVEASSPDASCTLVYSGGSSTFGTLPNAGVCKSHALSSAFVVDGGASVVSDSGVVSGSGGISAISCAYMLGVGPDCYTAGDQTVPGETATGYSITGLTNNRSYDVVVAAVDGSGNVGPPSSCVTDFPAPVSDFFGNYRTAGGSAGGGFCALEAVGLPTGSAGLAGGLAVSALAGWRRRRRGRRDVKRP